MRILYLADIRFPLERANGIQSMETCHALAARGHDVTLIVRPDTHVPARDPFAFYGLPRIPSLHVEVAPITGPAAARRAGYLTFTIGRALGRTRQDLIFTRDLGLASLLLRVPRRMRAPVVYEAHTIAADAAAALPDLLTGAPAASEAKLRRLAARDERTWKSADGYVTITSGLRRELERRFGPRPRIAVVPDGVRASDAATDDADLKAATDDADNADLRVATDDADNADLRVATDSADDTDLRGAADTADLKAATDHADDTDLKVAADNADTTVLKTATDGTDTTDPHVAPDDADTADLKVAPDDADTADLKVATDHADRTDAAKGSTDGVRPSVQPSPFTIGYAGHLYPWKGADLVVEAVAALPETRGLIVGGHDREPDLARVKALAAQLDCASRIVFTGLIPPAGVAARLREASVLVLPNPKSAIASEFTSPLKLFEYMASGRPIVASDLPSIREILRDGENALLVEPGNPQALVAGIARVKEDAALGRRLAARALADVREYSWERRAERLEALFASVVGAAT